MDVSRSMFCPLCQQYVTDFYGADAWNSECAVEPPVRGVGVHPCPKQN